MLVYVSLEWRCPEWELFNEQLVWFDELNRFADQVARLKLVLNSFAMGIQTVNHLRRKCIKAHVNEREVRRRQRVNPHEDLFKLFNCALIVIAVQILQLGHALVFAQIRANHVKHFWELFFVIFHDLYGLERVLPVRPYMLRTSCKLVVLKLIKLVNCYIIATLGEPDVSGNMHLFRPALHVQPNIGHTLFFSFRIFVSQHKRTSNP